MKKLKTRKSQIAYAVSSILALASTTLYAADGEEVSGDKEAERVIVTGSLIRRTEFRDEQPVEIISAEAAALQGIKNVGELMRTLTVGSGSPQVTAASGTEFLNAGGEGAETFSMRGLGANRTLVLLNGRRAGPAGTRGGVSSFDFNVLPIAMIERVEIMKDGASSLYGSDAVAGVVNIITKKGDDSEVNVFFSSPEEQGGGETRLSATWGHTVENGSFRVVADYNKQSELARGQRDYLTCGRRNYSDPNTGESRDPIDPRTGKPACYDLIWGHVWIYDYSPDTGGYGVSLAQYDYDGSLGAVPILQQYPYRFNNEQDINNPERIFTPEGWYLARYDRLSDGYTNANHPFQDRESLIPEVERTTVYAQGDYMFGNVNTYAELLLNRRKTKTNNYTQVWAYQFNGSSDDLWTENSQSDGWGGNNWLSPLMITDHAGSEVTVDYIRAVLGANGDIGSWYWDSSIQVSRSDGEYMSQEVLGDAVWSQDDDVYYGDETNPGRLGSNCENGELNVRGVPCAVIPWLDPNFLAGNVPADVAAYMFAEQTGKTIYKQASWEFVITGDVFELPAGPVGMAAGVSYRKDEINDTPGDLWLTGNAWGGTTAGITKGKDTTSAYFAEFRVPLMSNLPGVENLELSLSGRYTDVDSAGSADTYKASINWLVGSGFSVRASQGTSFRAPALFELYLADETGYVNRIDVCEFWQQKLDDLEITERIAHNCQIGPDLTLGTADDIGPDTDLGNISATVYTSGGLGELKPETSTAKTWGVVWNAEDIDLSVSLDHFEFLVEDEVTILGAKNIVRECYDSPNFPDDPICQLFERADGTNPDVTPYDNRIEPVYDHYINIARQINTGWDFAIDYSIEILFGQLDLMARYTRQDKSERELFLGKPEDKNGEFGNPKETATFNASLKNGEWSYNWGIQYFGAVSNVEREGDGLIPYDGEDVRVILSAGSWQYHSFSVTREFENSGWLVTAGAANVFDKRPPRVSTRGVDLDYIGDSAFYSQYDFIGRRFFADVTYKFK